jgi:hypothetical protein
VVDQNELLLLIVVVLEFYKIWVNIRMAVLVVFESYILQRNPEWNGC